VSVYLQGSSSASTFKIRGELGASSFQVSMKLPDGRELAVAAAERRQQPVSRHNSLGASSARLCTYDVLVESGMDAAFVTAACIVIDSMFNQSHKYPAYQE
jgi:type IV pilus biogenesis protein CpaD/CtpE